MPRLSVAERSPSVGLVQADVRSSDACLPRDRFHSVQEDVHLSRPATPLPLSNNAGKVSSTEAHRYRILYLLVRLEQQQDHLRQVLESTVRLDKPEPEIKNILNIQEAVDKTHGFLIGVRDNDHVIIKQIGNRRDIDEFLEKTENMCSRVEEIAVPGSRDDDRNQFGHIGNQNGAQEPRVPFKLRRRKHTPPICQDVLNRIQRTKTLGPTTTSETGVTNGNKSRDNVTKATVSTDDIPRSSSQNPNLKPTKKTGELPNIGGKMKEHSEVISLMKEIDALMDDAGLVTSNHGDLMSFESFMLGAGEKKVKDHVNKSLDGKTMDETSDLFIEELDRLLDDCEN